MIVQLEEIKNELINLKDDLLSLEETLSISTSKIRLKELENQTTNPSFWDNSENSQKVLSEISKLTGKIKEFEKLKNSFEYVRCNIRIPP